MNDDMHQVRDKAHDIIYDNGSKKVSNQLRDQIQSHVWIPIFDKVVVPITTQIFKFSRRAFYEKPLSGEIDQNQNLESQVLRYLNQRNQTVDQVWTQVRNQVRDQLRWQFKIFLFFMEQK